MFNLHEQVCNSFIAAIKESVQNGTPLVQIVAYIDECKEKGMVDWYAWSETHDDLTFKLCGDDRKFKISDKGILPFDCVDKQETPPPHAPAPAHILRAASMSGRVDTSKENNCENCNPKNPWHSVFNGITFCSDCGAVLTQGRKKCRYCEDRQVSDVNAEIVAKPVPETPKLFKCPVCGSLDIAIDKKYKDTFVTVCSNCKVSTGYKSTEEEAIADWNSQRRLDYTYYQPKPCPICGGEAVVSVRYPDNSYGKPPGLVVSSVMCRYHNCVKVEDAGVPPHKGVIEKWRYLIAPGYAARDHRQIDENE